MQVGPSESYLPASMKLDSVRRDVPLETVPTTRLPTRTISQRLVEPFASRQEVKFGDFPRVSPARYRSLWRES